MKKIIGLAALLAGTAGMFVLPAAAEGRRTTYTAPVAAYTQTYNNSYNNGRSYYNGDNSRAYSGDRNDRRDVRGRDHRDSRNDRRFDRDDWR